MKQKISPSLLRKHIYCKRTTWFEQVMMVPPYPAKDKKVSRGKTIYEQIAPDDKSNLRYNQGVTQYYREPQLSTKDGALYGWIDELWMFSDGSLCPTDYYYAEKPAKERHENDHIRMYAYAWMTADTFGQPVHKAALIYTKPKLSVDLITIEADFMEQIKASAAEIDEITRQNILPPATTQKRKCNDCPYKDLCTQY